MPVLKLWHVTDPKLSKELLHHEDLKKREVRCYKIGVLYAKEGQKSEEEILGNQESSEAFDRFLELLGDKVTLEGWKGYRGDLDVNQNKNGEYSVYTKLHNEIEVMFHVSTYLPYDAYDPQQIPRKKYIGNDLVTIVFLYPCKTEDGEDGYKLAVCSRKGVPQFGPPIPNPPTFKHNEYFRDFLLTKLMNGERAALHSPFIATKMKKSRQMQLEYIIKEFLPNAGE
ncbi:GTPase activating Rap/RanGAP domainlike 3, putative [Acanthamoeba castellanii str. Neff]|uniref:GTPase activating Rap/RanGAP domainlike 3, putative n=1 Tax=Acanthamoeba castellanii (strain ATCC 30010 / Neff) TaxID=1257118 RepID=L8H0P7_ACACF|nr:GTPase activating Rap/RanGAP domainlike 3, putative [Acanthamoeba castellanii str. Neff]ELR19059.1 GTPase activating Rap/RanGAP domainlike 3, putative [Acanthamoeba castellanii str. Neff]